MQAARRGGPPHDGERHGLPHLPPQPMIEDAAGRRSPVPDIADRAYLDTYDVIVHWPSLAVVAGLAAVTVALWPGIARLAPGRFRTLRRIAVASAIAGVLLFLLPWLPLDVALRSAPGSDMRSMLTVATWATAAGMALVATAAALTLATFVLAAAARTRT